MRRTSTARSFRTPSPPTRCARWIPRASCSRADRRASTKRALRRSTRAFSNSGCRCWASATGSRSWRSSSAARSPRPVAASTGRRRSHRSGPDSIFLKGQPDEQTAWMSHGDSVVRAPDGFEVLASSEVTPVAAFASDERKLLRGAVASRGQALGARAGGARELPASRGGHPRRLEQRQRDRRSGRPHPRAGRHRPRALRTLRRGRLGRRRGARARSRRRPAGVRLRRPRPVARERTAAGRAGLRRRHRGATRDRGCRRPASSARSPG